MNLKIALSLLTPVLLLASPVSAKMNYDCSKAGNANKTACKKTAVSTAKAATAKPAKTVKPSAVAATAKPAVAKKAAPNKTSAKASTQVASADSKDPKGATARCKDGMYSHSKTRTGACSRHGGVASWI